MLESLIRIDNFHWSGDVFQPDLAANDPGVTAARAAATNGRFACALPRASGGATLVRDRLGLNKLFVAVHQSGRVLVSSYLIDLVDRGVPFESVFSVPAGHVVDVDPAHAGVTLLRYAAVEETRSHSSKVDDLARDIRRQLDVWFERIAKRLGHRKVYVCLSGGLDSGVIAALARQYFHDVAAYTYTFNGVDGGCSEDAGYASRLAAWLGIPLRIVPASAEDVLGVLDAALCSGQDWRDFNVHCAIVNEILARAIRRDLDTEPPGTAGLVLTGDLANELLADYTPISYSGHDYYKLPDIGLADLRLVLVRGLDAGDREIGVFGRHGLDVLQPYGLVVDDYLRLPAAFLARDRSKQVLVRKAAGDLLPAFVFDRTKVRAQIGSSSSPGGILPVLAAHGYDAAGLRRAFCRVFRIENQSFLSRFVRAGRYRAVSRLSDARSLVNGYVAA